MAEIVNWGNVVSDTLASNPNVILSGPHAQDRGLTRFPDFCQTSFVITSLVCPRKATYEVDPLNEVLNELMPEDLPEALIHEIHPFDRWRSGELAVGHFSILQVVGQVKVTRKSNFTLLDHMRDTPGVNPDQWTDYADSATHDITYQTNVRVYPDEDHLKDARAGRNELLIPHEELGRRIGQGGQLTTAEIQLRNSLGAL